MTVFPVVVGVGSGHEHENRCSVRSACILVVSLAGSPAQSYEVSTVADGGTLEGIVVYRGDVPTRKIIPSKNVETCGGPREEPKIRVGADQAVESAVVYLVDVAKGKAWPEEGKPPELNNHQMPLSNRRFRSFRARSGGRRQQRPGAAQYARPLWQADRLQLGLAERGTANPRRATRPGTVFIDCDAHGWMEGWIYVVDNPYYAITGADGKFTISDVPPGDYKLVAVQSFTGPIEMPVTVKAGESTKLEIELKKK